MYIRIVQDANLPLEISDDAYGRLSVLNKQKYKYKSEDDENRREEGTPYQIDQTPQWSPPHISDSSPSDDPPHHFDFGGGDGGGGGATGSWDSSSDSSSSDSSSDCGGGGD